MFTAGLGDTGATLAAYDPVLARWVTNAPLGFGYMATWQVFPPTDMGMYLFFPQHPTPGQPVTFPYGYPVAPDEPL